MNAIHAPVYDVRTVEKLLNFQYSVAEFDSIGKPPDALPGFVTFFDPGWSIAQLRKEVADRATIFYPQDWYNNLSFAKLEEPSRYRQLQMDAVKDSFGRNFAEQQSLLSPDDEIPTARVVVMGMVIHFLATGERLFPNCCVRCADETSSDYRYRVLVGYFDRGGLDVHSCWDDGRDSGVGLASSRKF